MQQWVKAIARHTEFHQQMDPTADYLTQAEPGAYSPAALVYRLSHSTPSRSEP